ncbi:MAG: hypothetical protein OXE78_07750 [Gammaproteobacteria bacterium]|nr:hypothetical protein [Gammaproteobacteria bacterium]MCY4358639.1 hypothetical protein [Gammaproteobacteria bacterium]
MKPRNNEIEVTIFGPGYGECIVVHIGSGKWAIIDSCLDDDGREPASISYLRKLDVSIDSDVISFSASHWHDDHVKGLAKTISACKAAKLSFGSALQSKEFVAFLYAHEIQPVQVLDRGGTELLQCLKNLNESGRQPKLLSEDTLIFDYGQGELSHGLRVELRALSPSGKQFADFIQRIGDFSIKSKGLPKGRISEPSRNHLSVAMLLTIGNQGVLFGADLEQVSDSQKGWNAVVMNRRGRQPLSHVFKIPHHGSYNAYNKEVWKQMVDKHPWAIVTPWRKGGNTLPQDSDVTRIKSHTNNCYITSTKYLPTKKRYDRETIKQIKATKSNFCPSIFSCGRVTMRWVAGTTPPKVTLADGAKAL